MTPTRIPLMLQKFMDVTYIFFSPQSFDKVDSDSLLTTFSYTW